MSINIGGVVYPAKQVGETTRSTSVAVGIIEDGPKGDPGPTGPRGPSGASGPTGATGPAGRDGSDGRDGASGVTGATGPAGPPGLDGTNGVQDTYFRWVQGTPEKTWHITHTLNRPVSVDVIDSAGSIVEGDVTYLSPSELTIDFSAAFAGEAYLT